MNKNESKGPFRTIKPVQTLKQSNGDILKFQKIQKKTPVKFSLSRRSISYEPRSQLAKKEKPKKEKQPIPKVIDKIETKKKDEEIFAEKLKARMKASGDTDQETNFKPRTDYQPEKTVQPSKKQRSDTRRLSVGDVKPKVIERPESRSVKESTKKVQKTPQATKATPPPKPTPKVEAKKEPEVVKPDPKEKGVSILIKSFCS